MRDLQRCAEREANLRRKVYSNRVLTGRMSQRQANAEIDKMAAIAEWLRARRRGSGCCSGCSGYIATPCEPSERKCCTQRRA